jgi:hypothetical protein
MNLDAKKFGLATAIVTAVIWFLSRLLVLAAPYGPMRAGGGLGHGYMMRGQMMGWGRHGYMYGLDWKGYFAGFVIGLIVVPLVAGVAAWAVATVYNRLLRRSEMPTTKSSD